MHKLAVLELYGIDILLQHCAFSAQSGLYTDLCGGKGNPLLMSEAAESCLPSPLFWHELLSVIFALYIAEKYILVK